MEVTFLRTKPPSHATELARQEASQTGCTGVVSVGGDGTCYEVACGLMGTGVPLGIIPAGAGNDFFKIVGIPQKPLKALALILKGKPRWMIPFYLPGLLMGKVLTLPFPAHKRVKTARIEGRACG